MKIAILIERAEITLGGAERSVRDLACELNRRGITAAILAASGDRVRENLTILCSAQPGKRTPLEVFKTALDAHLKDNHYDLIHSTLPLPAADLYQPRGGSYRETLLQSVQSYPNPVRRWFKKTFHFLNRRRTQYLHAEEHLMRTNSQITVAALSEYVRGHFLQHYRLPEERIVVIPNGVRLPEQADRESAKALRSRILESARIRNPEQAVLFLFAANNFRLKGLRELISALSKAVKKTSAPLVLAVAGSGQPRPYHNLAWLQEVDGRVVFCGTLPEMQTALAACDAAVLPTWYDPSSRFILEALACGKPVITTAFNGAAEYIRSGRHGLLIDTPKNIRALAYAITRLADPGVRQQAAHAIEQDNLREKVSIARHADGLISLYNRILERKNSTP